MDIKFIFSLGVFAVFLLAGVVVSILNVRDAKGPKERRFVGRACLMIWGLLISMLLLAVFLEPPFRYIVIAGFVVLFPLLIFRFATMHQLIRKVDERDALHQTNEEETTDSRR